MSEDHTAALRDGIRILAYRLQTAAYNNGNIDAGEWSDKKYTDAADNSDSARVALMEAVDSALAQPQQPAGWRDIAPEGWKLVPVEPTEAMRQAAFNACEIAPGTDGYKTGTDAREAIYAAMLAAAPVAPAADRPTDDDLWDKTLKDRDDYHDMADKLARAIAEHFGVDIGEHSSANCPWANALDAIPAAPAHPAEQQSDECGACSGTGRMVRDPDIGTDQECFVCDGSGKNIDSPAEQQEGGDAPPEWMTHGPRRWMVVDSLRARANEMRDSEARCRSAYNEDYMGIPFRYIADAYLEAGNVFEARLAAIDAAMTGGSNG